MDGSGPATGGLHNLNYLHRKTKLAWLVLSAIRGGTESGESENSNLKTRIKMLALLALSVKVAPPNLV